MISISCEHNRIRMNSNQESMARKLSHTFLINPSPESVNDNLIFFQDTTQQKIVILLADKLIEMKNFLFFFFLL